MRLADVLKLPKQPHSLSIIKDYLNQSLTQLDYQAAYNYYFEIAIHLSLFDIVYEEAKSVLEEIKTQSETMYYEKILVHMIDASIELHKLDEAKKYILTRKEVLPIIKQYLGLLDDIKLKKALNEPYLEDLLKILQDMIPDDIKIFCLEEVFMIYKNDAQYEMALNSLYELYNYDLKTLYFIDELYLLIKLNRLDEAKTKAYNEHVLHKDDEKLILKLLEIYLKQDDLHKASILEAEYEELIDAQNETYRKQAYELIVDLYTKLDHKPSIDIYKSKLKKITKVIDKLNKQEEVKSDAKNQDVVIIEKKEEPRLKSTHILRFLEISHDLIEYSHTLDEKLSLREFFRLFFIHLDTFIMPKEYVVYLDQDETNFFHYKKERLYDKTIQKQDTLDTLIEHVMYTGDEIYESTKTIKWTKNVITQKDYTEDISFIYAFPIFDLGVFVIHLDEEIKDPQTYYDLFKLISAIIFTHIVDEKNISRIKYENKFYANVLNSPIMCYRELTESRSTYNDPARDLFHIDQHHHLELFLRDMSYEFVNPYKDLISYLFIHPNEERHIVYTYQERHILEKLYSLKVGDEVYIMSLFFDQTEDVKQAKQLVDQATIDPETNLSNLYALNQEIDEALEQKVSLYLIELDMSLKHIYGNDESTKYFKEFAQVTKKFFSEGITYRFDFNQIFVILPFNDIRATSKVVKDYYKHIESYTSKVLAYEKFSAYMGIIRYPVVTVEKDKDKLYKFLDISVQKAKREEDIKYAYFVYRDYEDELFEQQVMDHLNVAIEEKNIGLLFNQMIDLKKNFVWQYESEIILTNLAIDTKYLLKIAEKRNRLVDLEHFHIEQVCDFLSELEKQTERLIKITIPISKQTFLDPKFNSFLLGTLKERRIPYEFLRLKCDMDLRPNHYATQIQELIDHSISLDTTSVDMALNYPFHALHIDMKKDSMKWQSYISQMKIMLESYHMALVVRNVKTKDQKEMLERLGINYIEGSLYKEIPAPVLIRKIKESV
ncbi:MAG: EAL domain-containing protein [Acholeplasmataceae bacterium]|nr:EAL domain-containing protein [Acholeplasmataceae bacterium]